MVSAICLLVVLPAFFCRIIHFTFDSSSFLMTLMRRLPICLHLCVRFRNPRTIISILRLASVSMRPSYFEGGILLSGL